MDAFEVAHELLGALRLTTGQLTQLRTIDHKYWQAVFTLLHPAGEGARSVDRHAASGFVAPAPSLTPEQTADLHAMLVREVRGLVTPEQRDALGWA